MRVLVRCGGIHRNAEDDVNGCDLCLLMMSCDEVERCEWKRTR